MRNGFIAFAVIGLALSAGPVMAASDSPMAVCSQQWQAMKKAGTAKGSYKDFSKVCLSKGKTPAAPAAPAPAAAAEPAKKPSVLSAMMAKKPAPTAAAPAPAAPAAPAAATPAKAPKTAKAKGAPTVKASDTDPTGATAQCKDGTYSHSKTHSGSCAGHKGVAKFLT